MHQATDQITIPTQGQALYEFTPQLRAFTAESGIETGLLTVFVRHTSCSLIIQENADPDVQFVAVSVKAPDHAAAIKPVLAAKKNVFSEWPLGKNLDETKELAALAKEANVRTLIGLQAWQSPLVNKVAIISHMVSYGGTDAL